MRKFRISKNKPKTPAAEEMLEPSSGQDVKIKPKKKKFFRRRWFKNTMRLILLAALIFGIVMFVRFKLSRKQEAPVVQTTSVVTRGGVDVSVTGSGTVQPIESYTLSSLVTGTILECGYDEGQMVEKGAVLYRFEDTDAQTRIKTAENAVKTARRAVDSADKAIEQAAKSIETAKKNVENAKEDINDALNDIEEVKERIGKLTVRAPISGVIEELSASVGKRVSGSIGRIQDYSDLSATVSFNNLQIQKIKENDPVSVGIAKLMTNVSGTVAKKYTAPHIGTDGTIMYAVKIQLEPGINLAAGTTVSVTVHTAEGDVECPSYGTITYVEPEDIELEEAGEVTAVYVESGNYVEKGTIIAKLQSDSLEKELKAANDAYQAKLDALSSAQDALEAAQDSYDSTVADRENAVDGVSNAENELETVIKAAEDYTITSPVSGVILEKYYKTGDTYGNDDNKKLMVVADMSSMVFSINVDELDISNIEVGQTVNITADALPGEMLTGTVTAVSKIGNAENGVTGYPVEVTIYDIGNLMSGMNVTAEINVGSVQDVIVAPASAIFMIDGMYYATVVTPAENEGDPETETQVQVEVGLHSSDFYEIKSGLNEGDVLRDSGIGSDGGDDMYYYGW